MSWGIGRLGMRARVTAIVAIGALVLSTAIAVLSYQIIRYSLLTERERTASRTAFADAAVVRNRLSSGTDVVDALRLLGTGTGRRPALLLKGDWYALGTDTRPEQDVPMSLRQRVDSGLPGLQRSRTTAGPAIVVGIPLDGEAQYYEVVPLTDPEEWLDLVALVLTLVAAGVTLAGAGFGWYVGRRALRPML